jgi:hypothetical protein
MSRDRPFIDLKFLNWNYLSFSKEMEQKFEALFLKKGQFI